jgi:nucleoside-diphosphate-sugar epimerase
MPTLVTGAGLIGTYTAALLASQGERVVLYDLAPDAAFVRQVLSEAPCSLVAGDVRDLPLLLRTAQQHQVDTIVHSAALIAGRAQDNPYQSHAVNVGGTMNVAEVARAVNARRLVYCSTYGVYDMAGCQERPIAEDAPILQDFDLVYSATKYAAECLLSAVARTHALSVVALRFASVFGFGTFAGGAAGGAAVHALLTTALRGAPGPLLPGASVRNEWLYVKDAAAAVVAACAAPAVRPYAVYNIGSGALHSPEQLLDAVRAVVPGAEFEALSSGLNGVKPPERAQPFDLAAAARDLGYRPQYPLEVALRDYVAELSP